MLNSIRIFVKVVEQGSFSRAGRILNLAPSSITRNIDQLENELGVTLFKRSTRQLVLTDEGHLFHKGAGQLLAQADALTQSLKVSTTEPEGVLRISAFESFGRIQVCPLLPEFLERYPKLRIEIELENRMVDLVAEDIDLAIRIGRPADSSLRARLLLPSHTLLCASPQYLERYGTPKIPDELESHNCLLLRNNRQKIYWHFRAEKKSKKVPVDGNLTATGGTPLLQAALNGSGIAQLASWMMVDYIEQGLLVICLPDWKCTLHDQSCSEVYAAYRQSSYIKPSIRAFIDFLVEKIQNKTFRAN